MKPTLLAPTAAAALLASIAITAFTSCSNGAASTSEASITELNCVQTGFTSERVCKVSHFQALGSDHYMGKVIRISGYVVDVRTGDETNRLLFFSQEQAALPNVGGAILVGSFSADGRQNRMRAYEQVLEANIGKPVELIGTLRKNQAIGLSEPPRAIDNIVGVNALNLGDRVIRGAEEQASEH